MSLTENSLDIATDTGATPILVPASHGDMASLLRAAEAAERRGIAAILDPILDPIHFGFMASLMRYADLRRQLPQADILMGTGNLTELTDADSGGVTAMLLGICSELHIRNVLVVQVSPHTHRTIQEHDAARRMMFAAREDASLPRDYGGALLQLHDRAEARSEPLLRDDRAQRPERPNGAREEPGGALRWPAIRQRCRTRFRSSPRMTWPPRWWTG